MNKRILLLGPHTDDIEIGCGASVAKWIREGNEVMYYAFSATSNRNVLMKEMMGATRALGIPKDNIHVLDYTVRLFNRDRQSILTDMLAIKANFNPDLVVVPSSYSRHQDHEVIREEAFRAFKNISIIGYEDVWNNQSFSTDIFNPIEQEDIDKKIDALSCYTSQKDKSYMSPDFTRSLAKVRGVTVNRKYAEVFECIREVM